MTPGIWTIFYQWKCPHLGVNMIDEEKWSFAFLEHSKNRIVYRVRNSIYNKVFFDYVKDKNLKILDIGCGNGEFLKRIKQSGYHNVHGIDPNPYLLEESKETSWIKEGSATRIPFEDHTFDCIYIFNILHHLKSKAEYPLTFAEIDRVLKPNGTFILVEPCNKWIYSLLFTISRIFKPFHKVFQNYYTMLDEEWPELSLFFKVSKDKDFFYPLKFKFLFNKKVFHQWVVVLQKDPALPIKAQIPVTRFLEV